MNNHERRLDRIAAASTGTGLPPVPTQEELRAEIEKMEADPSYVSIWTHEMLEGWTAQLEQEIAEADLAP